eukprot:TRINITY_DN6039_c0_g1_i1.p1 TRINITY_DN6039_c0_g1~~TRINITY_DN6039_c0_g1_i1.p1  ORF type:complete len:857 (+),score=251.64 TRINITY_DN6039_c0_g1_i1:26-2596(+)
MRKNRRPKENPYIGTVGNNTNTNLNNQEPRFFNVGGNNNQINNNNNVQDNGPMDNSNNIQNNNQFNNNNTNNNNNEFNNQMNGNNNQFNNNQFNNTNNNNLNNLTNQFSELSTGSGSLGIQNGNNIKYSNPIPLRNYQANDNVFSMTLNQIPQSQAILSKSQIPLGAVIHPLAAGIEIPVVDLGPAGVIRCKNCRAYINPFVEFIEGGRRWRCSFCYFSNEVHSSYYRELDSNGTRVDINERPELTNGVCEFLAPSEYLVGAPQAPIYLFCIDVSYTSVTSGLLSVTVAAIKNCLDKLPGESRTRIGFVTFDSNVHVYNLRSTLSKPQLLVVPDIEDLFLPVLAEDILVNLTECRSLVDDLLEKLPAIWEKNTCVDSSLGPALKVCYAIAKNHGGRILVQMSALPNLGAKIGLEQREQKRSVDVGTDNENLFYKPQNEEYQKIATNCSTYNITVDVFVYSTLYVDNSTIGVLPTVTGGELFMYGLHGSLDNQDKITLYNDICKVLYMRETGFQSVMRLRCSKGIEVNPKFIFGNFFIKNVDLLHMPHIDSEKSFGFQMKITENLTFSKYVCFQAVLLYTSTEGVRKMRVMTKCLPVTSSMLEIYRSANTVTTITLLSKMALDKAITTQIKYAREALLNKVSDIIKVYKVTPGINVNTSSVVNLPESLINFPLYTFALLKHYVFSIAKGIRPDTRNYFFHKIRTMSCGQFLKFIHPNLYPVTFSNETTGLPSPVRLTSAELTKYPVFVLDNFLNLYLWIGKTIPTILIQSLFGVNDYNSIVTNEGLPTLENEYSTHLKDFINNLRQENRTYQKLYIIREGDPLTVNFLNFLIEDKTNSAPPISFHQFLLQLQTSTSN